MNLYSITVTCAAGLERHLKSELEALCPERSFNEQLGRISTDVDLHEVYRVLTWSRVGSRVLLNLASVAVDDDQGLYDAVASVPWTEHFGAEHTFAVDFKGRASWLRNSQYGAFRVKDAIVDVFRDATGQRPNVDTETPSIRLFARLNKGRVDIGIDLSGPLHRRGYREGGGLAPIRETLAAALLMQVRWPELAKDGQSFYDPMCGTGTFVIEAAMMATDMAPGLLRSSLGCEQWYGHSDLVAKEVLDDAKERFANGQRSYTGAIVGSEISNKALQAAQRGVSKAGLKNQISIVKNDITQEFPEGLKADVILVNPPYGKKVGDPESLPTLYRELGEQMLALEGAKLFAVITSEPELCRYMPLRSPKLNRFNNGELEATFLQFDLTSPHTKANLRALPTEVVTPDVLGEQARVVYNRMKKNYRGLKAWLKREGIDAYRLYDADIPEFSAAIDVYGDQFVVSEYAAPKTIPEAVAKQRWDAILQAVSAYADVPVSSLHTKARQRQRGRQQYQQAPDEFRTFVTEFDCEVEVELERYLDTGLFLDHRPLRRHIANIIGDGKFLNLFSYTAVASLHAAKAGATTTSVDMSNTYLDWARRNFERNNIDPRYHDFVRANCLEWLQMAQTKYDVIMLDPPTFSNSKRMEDSFDVQKDHVFLIENAMRLLQPEGALFFSNNFRKFKLDPKITEKYLVTDLSAQSIDQDFKRNPKIHSLWEIQHRV